MDDVSYVRHARYSGDFVYFVKKSENSCIYAIFFVSLRANLYQRNIVYVN